MNSPFSKSTSGLISTIVLSVFALQAPVLGQAVGLFPEGLPVAEIAPLSQPEVAASPSKQGYTPPSAASRAARAEATAKYPQLGRAGTAFNREFLSRIRCYQAENPGYFDNGHWPLALADEIAASGIPSAAPALPSVPAGSDLLVDNVPSSGVRLVGRTAYPHSDAPGVVQVAMMAGNQIQTKPYKWGGGHGQMEDWGYDCSGSVSYVLMKAGLLSRVLTSGSFASYGESGPGRWITIYAGSGHVFMTVCGIRLDTGGHGGRGESGPRWCTNPRYGSGFVMRHPPGL